jgi:hypothetical protein
VVDCSDVHKIKEKLEEIVKFGPGPKVEVYPEGSPAVGTQLNRPAIIELHEVAPLHSPWT